MPGASSRSRVRASAPVVATCAVAAFAWCILCTVPAAAQSNRPHCGVRPADFDAPQTATDTPPAARDFRQPEYPPRAMREGREGMVILQAAIDAGGDVVYAEVRRGSGFADLDSAALAAVCASTFAPARRDGRPVGAVVSVPMRFRLKVTERDTEPESLEELRRDTLELRRAKRAMDEEKRRTEEEIRRLRENHPDTEGGGPGKSAAP